MRDEMVELPDVDSSVQVDLDVVGPRPQLELGVEVEHPPPFSDDHMLIALYGRE